MSTYLTPGVYLEPWQQEPSYVLPTGVPGFLGFVRKDQEDKIPNVLRWDRSPVSTLETLGREPLLRDLPLGAPQQYTRWSQFEETLRPLLTLGYLRHAVKGFFANGGRLCYVHVAECPQAWPGSLTPDLVIKALEAFKTIEDVDLICVPDLMCPEFWYDLSAASTPDAQQVLGIQAEILRFCDEHGRYFAILDSLPGADATEVLEQRRTLRGDSGALYYPWIKVPDGPDAPTGFIPPCGHVAAVYARSDEHVGVHKAPANEALNDVVDLQVGIDSAMQAELNPEGVNCIRAFPGRGIRVWGARTLSTTPFWTYVNVRRIFITAARWIDRNMAGYVFEPHTPELWARITRDLTAYFTGLQRLGALKGTTPEEAFFVKCDQETNPEEARDLGQVVTEIGLAPTEPGEFIVVRIIQRAGGMNIVGPGQFGT